MDTFFRAGELALTYNRTQPDGPKIQRPADIINMIRPLYGDEMEVREKFIIIGVSRSNNLRSTFIVGDGGAAACVVDPKLVFSRLLLDNCAAFICTHNHPSGNPRPSLADDRLTRQLKESGKTLDLPLLDHVIVTTSQHYSYADHGKL